MRESDVAGSAGVAIGRVRRRRSAVGASAMIAVITMAAHGCRSGVVDGSGGPDLTGRWAMFRFEDPVAVDLEQVGSTLSGQGCCDGFALDGTSNDLMCCAAITNGRVAGRHASFGFTFGPSARWPEAHVYATDVFVSADGQRMTGSFSQTGYPVAWVRFTNTLESLWGPTDPALVEGLWSRSGRYTLALSDASPAAGDFSAGTAYQLIISASSNAFLMGDLGAFWAGEMSWRPDTRTLVVGPVPETAPDAPVALVVQFGDDETASVEATMPSGSRYLFAATLTTPAQN